MELWNSLMEMMFPRRQECVVCGRETHGAECFCRLCQDKMIKRGHLFCPVCGRYWPEYGLGNRQIAPLCGECQYSSPPFFAARSLGVYGGILKDSIYIFKYRRKCSLAVCLGRLLAGLFLYEKVFHGTQLLVPVPLSIEKTKERGFNQCELLAEETGRRLGIPVRSCLRKVKNTPSLSKLTRESRREAIKGVFELKVDLSGEKILLIDDIFTTGATAGECAKVLLDGGAGNVGILTLASGVLKKVEDSAVNEGKCRDLSNLP